MESCGMSCIKYLLFIFNLIFAISGIGIIVCGAVVLANIGEYSKMVEGRIMAPPVVLIVIGSIVFIVAFLGCFGAIRESYSMLMAFGVFLLIIFIMELAVGIAAAVYKNDSNVHVVLKDKMRESMKNYSISEDAKKEWDNTQQTLECCGIDGPADWKFTLTPSSCCQKTQENNEEASPICNTYKSDAKYLRTTGCYEKMKMLINAAAVALIGVGIGIAFIEVIGIILACWLASTIKKENAK